MIRPYLHVEGKGQDKGGVCLEQMYPCCAHINGVGAARTASLLRRYLHACHAGTHATQNNAREA